MIINNINNTKTIAAPDTPVLYISHASFFSFHNILWIFWFYVNTFPKLLFFLVFFDIIIMDERSKKMKRKILECTIMVFLFGLTGCNKIPTLTNGDELVAKIKGKKVTANEVYAKLRTQYGTSATINIIDDFIANKEIETNDDAIEYGEFQLEQIKLNFTENNQDFNEALKTYGYENEQELLDEIILEYKKTKLVENYYMEQVTDKEVEKYYDENIFGEMDVRHILIIPDEKDTEEEQEEANNKALEKAEKVIKKLDDGENFETLVKEYSDDEGSVDDGGLIANVTKDNYVDEFFQASLELKNGKYTKSPVKSSYGYHVILKVKQKEKPSLKDTKDEIIETLANNEIMNSEVDATQIAWSEIRKQYNIEIFDKDIKRIYNANISSLTK